LNFFVFRHPNNWTGCIFSFHETGYVFRRASSDITVATLWTSYSVTEHSTVRSGALVPSLRGRSSLTFSSLNYLCRTNVGCSQEFMK
jgi:hypothetical protein